MKELNEIEKGNLCFEAVSLLSRTEGGLKNFPRYMKQIIKYKAWEERASHGRVIRLNSLTELITLEPIEGWGESLKNIENIIRDDEDALAMFREATTAGRGGNNNPQGLGGKSRKVLDDIVNGDNVPIDKKRPERSNSAAYTAQRLLRDYPEIYQEYKAGKYKSLNEAAIKAGFRKATMTIPEEPVAAATAIKRRYSKTEIDVLVGILTEKI